MRLIFDRFIKTNPSLEKKILNSNCDPVLVPTNGYSAEIYDILKILLINFEIKN